MLTKQSQQIRYTYLTAIATEVSENFKPIEVAIFHCFNPRGAYKRYKSMANTIIQYINDGVVPRNFLSKAGQMDAVIMQRLMNMVSKDHKIDVDSLVSITRSIEHRTNDNYTTLGDYLTSDNEADKTP